MKKIKVALVAVAFMFAAGSAFASYKAKVGLPDCNTKPCLPDPSAACCINAQHQTVSGDFQN